MRGRLDVCATAKVHQQQGGKREKEGGMALPNPPTQDYPDVSASGNSVGTMGGLFFNVFFCVSSTLIVHREQNGKLDSRNAIVSFLQL